MNQAIPNSTEGSSVHWHEDMAGNVAALVSGLAALAIAFQPNIAVFTPFGISAAQVACARSTACKDIRVQGPTSLLDMRWTVWVEPSGAGTQADRQALRDEVIRAAVRDPEHTSVILGAMPATTRKGH